MGHNVAELVRLRLITDDRVTSGRDLVASALAAERGGVTSVQLRLKRVTAADLADATRALVQALRIPVLVNDRPDVALAAGAAGVHLGPEDLPVPHARRIAPPGFLIGASVGGELEAAAAGSADYWGIGPWRSTSTKEDAGAGLGAEGFRRLLGLAAGKPGIAIGGITPEDVPIVIGAGGSGVAVVSGILGAADIEAAAARYAYAATGKAGGATAE
jgi:thiamine-phosphate pyrophosphorylase